MIFPNRQQVPSSDKWVSTSIHLGIPNASSPSLATAFRTRCGIGGTPAPGRLKQQSGQYQVTAIHGKDNGKQHIKGEGTTQKLGLKSNERKKLGRKWDQGHHGKRIRKQRRDNELLNI